MKWTRRELWRGLAYWVPTWLLLIVFVVTIAVGGIVMLAAFADLVGVNWKVDRTLSEIRDCVAGVDSKQPNASPPSPPVSDLVLRTGAERLKDLTAGALHSSVIAFLFQVFSITLVGAGVFLLRRTHQDLMAVEMSARAHAEMTQSLSPFLDAQFGVVLMFEQMAAAAVMIHDLRVGGEPAREDRLLVRPLDLLGDVRGSLQEMMRAKRGFGEKQRKNLLGIAQDAETHLRSVEVHRRQGERRGLRATVATKTFEEALRRLREIAVLLGETAFTEWYKRDLQRLLGKAGDALTVAQRR